MEKFLSVPRRRQFWELFQKFLVHFQGCEHCLIVQFSHRHENRNFAVANNFAGLVDAFSIMTRYSQKRLQEIPQMALVVLAVQPV